MVGLARIELATSSLSGMRSNRLSYSPSTGLLTLSVGMVRLNRASHHFFFQDGDPNAPHQFGDEVENDGSEHPNACAQHNAKETKHCKASEQLPALEGKRVPAKGGHELLEVVDGACGRANIPEQDAGDHEDQIQSGVKDKAHFEDTPRIDVSQDS